MVQLFTAVMTGILVGLLFSLLRLPIPAPPTLTGVMGIIGIYLGYILGKSLIS